MLILLLIMIRYNKLADLRDGKLNNAGSNSIERSSLVEDMVCDMGFTLVCDSIDYRLLTIGFSKCIFF